MPVKTSVSIHRILILFASAVAVFSGTGFPFIVQAEEYRFDPTFLGGSDARVADLSAFEQGLELLPGVHRTDVYVNKQFVSSQALLFIIHKKEAQTVLSPCMSEQYLVSLGVNALLIHGNASEADTGTDKTCLFIDHVIDGAEVSFDQQALRLDISVPQAALVNKARGYIAPEYWDAGLPSAILNYTFNGSRYRYNGNAASTGIHYFLSLNGGLNLGDWRFRNYSTWNYSDNSGGHWDHIKSYAQRDIVPLRSRLTLGDTFTSLNVFDSVSLRGIQLESSESMLPESRRGFAPEVRGIATTSARVTVKQNGNTIYQTYVAPGAFTINDLYPTSSSGDLDVTVEEEGGKHQTFTVPFSSVANLVREGMWQYAVSVGAFRGTSSQNSPDFLQASVYHGLPAGFTIYGGAQISEKYQAYSTGAGRNMGLWGALTADITHADAELVDGKHHTGESFRLHYAKSLTGTGTTVNFATYRYSTRGFYLLGDTAYKRMSGGDTECYIADDGKERCTYTGFYNLGYVKKAQSQGVISQKMGTAGSLFASLNQQTYWNTDKKALSVQIGWSGNAGPVSYNISGLQNRNPWDGGTDRMLSLSLSLPLRELLSGSTMSSARLNHTSTQASGHRQTNSLGVSGTLLEDNNLSYRVAQRYSNQTAWGGDLSATYKGGYGIADMGYSYGRNSQYLKYGLSGGIVAHEDGITLSQQTGNTSVLVRAPGASDVSVRNHTGVRTDWRGYAVIPYVTAYRENRVELDINTLGEEVELDDAVVSVVPTDGALVRADFTARAGYKALFRISHDRQPVPFGSSVFMDNNGKSGDSIVSDNGMTYVTGLAKEGRLDVKWGNKDTDRCSARYTLTSEMRNAFTGVYRGTLECQ